MGESTVLEAKPKHKPGPFSYNSFCRWLPLRHDTGKLDPVAASLFLNGEATEPLQPTPRSQLIRIQRHHDG